jgi:hypothetical protein
MSHEIEKSKMTKRDLLALEVVEVRKRLHQINNRLCDIQKRTQFAAVESSSELQLKNINAAFKITQEVANENRHIQIILLKLEGEIRNGSAD